MVEPIDVRLATKDDLRAMCATLGRAFFDDPVQLFLFPDEARRLKKVERLFGTFLKAHYLKQGSTVTTAGVTGVSMWAPPGHATFSPLEILSQAVPMLQSFGLKVQQALKVLDTIEKRHPTEPHWYLGVLGTDPASQGLGIGAALLQPILTRCDEEGLPAYLESSKDRNVPYYRRFGFEVTEEIPLPNGGPSVWGMWRAPQS